MSIAARPPAVQDEQRAGEGGGVALAAGCGRAYALATFLLLVPALAAGMAAIGFAAGLAVSPLHLPAAVVASALATWAVGAAEGLRRREVLVAVALGLATLVLSAAVGHLAWDLSYDGQAYHQSAIRLLAAGWNPVRHALTPGETTHGLWLNHYVRAAELGAAAVTALTGSVESGKALGIAVAVPATAFCALALVGEGASRRAAAAVALVAAANPIVVSQLATFYVDGQLALVFGCALALAWMAYRGRPRTAPWLFAAALVLLANVKFTGTVYAALLLAGYALAALASRPRPPGRRLWLPAALAVAATLAVGWQPLATNAAEHGHPFHPVAGPSRVDGLSGQMPRFRYGDPLRRLVEATFSESDAGRPVPAWKLPFVVRAGELEAMTVPDVRVGGFGPLFALALVCAALGLAALPWAGWGRAGAGLLVAAGVLATVLVNRGAWWARFVPQLWLAAVLAGAALASARGAARAFGVAALVALAADAALVAAVTVRHQAETQAAAARQARDLARRYATVELPRGEMESLDLRLARAGLRARWVPGCARALPLVGTYASYCEPAAEPPPPPPAPPAGRGPG